MQIKVEDFHTHVENNDSHCKTCDDIYNNRKEKTCH